MAVLFFENLVREKFQKFKIVSSAEAKRSVLDIACCLHYSRYAVRIIQQKQQPSAFFMIGATDQVHIGALVLLDLSTSFDTVDHQILAYVLQRRFAIAGGALDWIVNILSDRCQVFTALHVMQTRFSDENSVRASVCPSVRPSHACIVTKQ